MAVLARMRSSQGQAWRGRVSVWGGAFEALMADTDASGSTPALDTMANPESPGIACVEPVLGTGSGAVEKVVSWVEKPSLSPGETTRLFAVALDAWGLPVLTPIALAIDGESVPVLNTSPSGVAQAVWTGPDATGLSILSSTAADQRDEAVLRVGTKFTTRLGSVGTAQERIEAEAWRNAVRCVELISAPPQAEGPAAIDSEPPEAPESPEPTAVPETTETSAPDTGQAPEEPSPWGSEEPSPWGDP